MDISKLATAADLGFPSLTRGFVTLCLPNLETFKMRLTDNHSVLAQKQVSPDAATKELNLQVKNQQGSCTHKRPSSSSEIFGTESTERLFDGSNQIQNVFGKFLKLREKLIVHHQFLVLKKKLSVVSKRKRSVSFADDNGLPLEVIRVVEMTGDSNLGDDDTTLDLAEASSSSSSSSSSTGAAVNYSLTPWIMAFFQPVFSRRKLKQTLAENGVALETVDVEDARLSGTIRADIDSATAQRRVFVRCSTDGWRTFCDVTARQVPRNLDCSLSDSVAVYHFEMDIPEAVLHVQFAVCLSDSGGQRWDDNNGGHYILLHHSYLRDEASDGSHSQQLGDSAELQDSGRTKDNTKL